MARVVLRVAPAVLPPVRSSLTGRLRRSPKRGSVVRRVPQKRRIPVRLCYFEPLPIMKLAGFLLLISGWCLVVAALGMLPASGARAAFVVAGAAVEIVGLVLAIRAHLPPRNKTLRAVSGMEGMR